MRRASLARSFLALLVIAAISLDTLLPAAITFLFGLRTATLIFEQLSVAPHFAEQYFFDCPEGCN